MPVCVCVGKIGLFRELNPGPPAPEAGIIPLDQTAKCVAYTLLRGCLWFGVVVLGGWRGHWLTVVARCLLSSFGRACASHVHGHGFDPLVGAVLRVCRALWPARLGSACRLQHLLGHGARSVAVSYKPSMLVTRVRLPACASPPVCWTCCWCWFFGFALGGCRNSPHWGLNPGPSVYKTDALPLSYRGVAFRRRGGIEPLHVSMPRELKSRPGTSPTHPGCSRADPMLAVLVSSFVGLRVTATATARGFEPLRAEPNGFLVHHLNHSVTLSWCMFLLGALLVFMSCLRLLVVVIVWFRECLPSGIWRNGSASDSRSEGWEFESLCPQCLLWHDAVFLGGGCAHVLPTSLGMCASVVRTVAKKPPVGFEPTTSRLLSGCSAN
jgi:hypothetical protein